MKRVRDAREIGEMKTRLSRGAEKLGFTKSEIAELLRVYAHAPDDITTAGDRRSADDETARAEDDSTDLVRSP